MKGKKAKKPMAMKKQKKKKPMAMKRQKMKTLIPKKQPAQKSMAKTKCGNKLCKDKGAMARKDRTGGLYVTMSNATAVPSARASSSNSSHFVELREFLNNEDAHVREEALRAVTARCPNVDLLIHDLVCHCGFAKKYVSHMLLDRFHARNHTRHCCRTTFNPKRAPGKALMKKHAATNTSLIEQTWTALNRNTAPRSMNRQRYRCYWRHYCIGFNKNVVCKPGANLKDRRLPAAVTRRGKLKTFAADSAKRLWGTCCSA